MRGRLLIRGEGDRLRSSLSFSVSACLHGALLGWLVLYSAVTSLRTEPPKSAYDLEIRPYEKHLVWYNLKEKLPNVNSGARKKDARPLRAKLKFPQQVVAGEKDLPAPPQLIRMPAPKIALPKELALPNVLAVAPPPPRPVKPFQPPPAPARPVAPALDLPNAPRLTTSHPDRALPFDAALPKPKAREFTAPPLPRRAAPPPDLPDPAAPELKMAAAQFEAPKIPKGFTAPNGKTATHVERDIDDAPPVPTPTVTAPATLAIVGLNPVKAPDAPLPRGSHEAGFSAGPEVHPKGAAEAAPEKAAVTVPGLVARGGAKDPAGSLLSVFAPLAKPPLTADASPPGGVPPPRSAEPRAAHVSSSPDSRMKGRYVYTVAIQMPNVTSYSGSWIVWFADRDATTGSIPADMKPPVAIRKVDPKYIVTAVEERVQGIVRLAAVIRHDGHIENVELLQHLDERLDKSAQEALAKWIFEPALRNGVAVDVDAVFEIPFRLPPKNLR
ncbi:MAG TPA: energy transducer TonB [Candidatus Sulfopaludibacter sp.]|jgi:protein TonB|nr:energy transducer TonB [Candidatus Sulfopaludibacter sp.]